MTLFDRVKNLAEEQKKSINDVENDLDYPQNTLYRLKRTNPSAKKLEELADYFQVSTDYLLGRSNSRTTSSDDEFSGTLAAHMKDRNHKFTPDEVDRIIGYLDGIIDADQAKKKNKED